MFFYLPTNKGGNYMSNKFFNIALVALPLLLTLSCSCGHLAASASGEVEPNILTEPRKSFLMIDVDVVRRTCNKETKTCETNTASLISGSGFVVAEAPSGGSYVITAAHVCKPSIFREREETNLEIIDYRLEISALTKEMMKFSLKAMEIDTKSDLCMLHGPDLIRPPIKIADQEMAPGERTFNIAAPRGILHGEAPLIIDGIYNGISKEVGKALYTMLVAGGSSGSVIMNAEGEAVGMVSMMDVRFPYVVYSPTHDMLRKFVDRALLWHAKSTIGIDRAQHNISSMWEKIKNLDF